MKLVRRNPTTSNRGCENHSAVMRSKKYDA